MSNVQIPQVLLQLFRNEDYGRVVLFGSRVRGNFGPNSDYDLLVIVNGSLTRMGRLDLAKEIRVKLAQVLLDADVIVRTQAEVEELKNRPGSVVRNALEHGLEIG